MLQISPLEILFRGVPESFLLIFISYLFTHKKVNKKLCFISSVLLAVITYLVRMLPIHFGVHTIIMMIIYIIVIVVINQIPINKAISSILSGTIMLLICEWINLFILDGWVRVNIEVILKKPLMKILYFIPSLILFACMIWVLRVLINKTKKEDSKNVFN